MFDSLTEQTIQILILRFDVISLLCESNTDMQKSCVWSVLKFANVTVWSCVLS